MKGDEKWKSPSRDESGPGKGANQLRESIYGGLKARSKRELSQRKLNT